MYIQTHLTHHQASKNAKMLSEQLVEVIRTAKQSNPDLSYRDVNQATLLTITSMRGELGGMSHQKGVLLGIALLAGLIAAFILYAILN